MPSSCAQFKQTTLGYTVDRKYFVLKIIYFVHKKSVVFNFCEPVTKLNTDHTLYVTLCTSTIGTATMDTLEREKRDKLILLEIVLRSHSLDQLLNVDRIVTEGCGQIDTNDRSIDRLASTISLV